MRARPDSIADVDREGIDAFIERLWSEDGLADRTLEAYRHDLEGLARWLNGRGRHLDDARREDLSGYLGAQHVSARSMARRQTTFRRYYAHRVRLDSGFEDPTLLLQRPKLPRGLPKALAEREVEALLAAPDVATPLGLRDRAMLELMYASGLRVSELVNLPLAGLSVRQGVLRVTGKGGKERLVPVGETALDWIERYLAEARPHTGARAPADGVVPVQPRRGDEPADVLDPGQALCDARSASTPGASRRTCCGIPSPRTCSIMAPTCARCRCCWATAR